MLTGKDLITALRARGQSDQLAQWAADALESHAATETAAEAPKNDETIKTDRPIERVAPVKKAATKTPSKKTAKR